jgi:hypothetical protein
VLAVVSSMVLKTLANTVLSPLQAIGRVLSSRLVRTFSRTAASKYRPSKSFSLPVIEYGQLSALYFAIDQAVQDDEVRSFT